MTRIRCPECGGKLEASFLIYYEVNDHGVAERSDPLPSLEDSRIYCENDHDLTSEFYFTWDEANGILVHSMPEQGEVTIEL